MRRQFQHRSLQFEPRPAQSTATCAISYERVNRQSAACDRTLATVDHPAKAAIVRPSKRGTTDVSDSIFATDRGRAGALRPRRFGAGGSEERARSEEHT